MGPFGSLAASGRAVVLDGEIAVPDDRGVTHIDLLQDAFGRHGADRLTYFAFVCSTSISMIYGAPRSRIGKRCCGRLSRRPEASGLSMSTM